MLEGIVCAVLNSSLREQGHAGGDREPGLLVVIATQPAQTLCRDNTTYSEPMHLWLLLEELAAGGSCFARHSGHSTARPFGQCATTSLV